MENKEKYYKAFIDNEGRLNEIDLGEKLGLNDDETEKIIVQLLYEHKIVFEEHRSCNYRLNKTIQKKNRRASS